MNTPSIISVARARGVELWFEGPALRFRAPAGALTDELRSALASGRDEVIAELQREAEGHVRFEPMSFAQRGMWFAQHQDPGSRINVLSSILALSGEIDESALRAAFQALFDRHDILRTTYALHDGDIMQKIVGFYRFTIETIDMPGADDEAIRSWIENEFEPPLDLKNGPVFQATLLVRENDMILVTGSHHIATDGLSMTLLFKELLALYEEFTGGTPAALSPAPSYAEYARWHNGVVEGPQGQRMLESWKKMLAPPLEPLDLPLDRARPVVPSYQGDSVSFQLDAELMELVARAARNSGTTTFAFLLGCFHIFLARVGKSKDVIIGVPVLGRSRKRHFSSAGNFVNSIPIRMQLSGEETASGALSQLADTMLDALDAQEYPFALLVQKINPQRHHGEMPFFNTFFTLINFDRFNRNDTNSRLMSGGTLDVAGMKIEIWQSVNQAGLFDLSLLLSEVYGAYQGDFRFATDVLDRSTAEKFASAYVEIVRLVAESPLTSIASLIGPDETETLETEEFIISATDEAAPMEYYLVGEEYSPGFDNTEAIGETNEREISLQICAPGWKSGQTRGLRKAATWLVCGGSPSEREQVIEALGNIGMSSEAVRGYNEVAVLLTADAYDGLILLDGLGADEARAHFDSLYALAHQLGAIDRSKKVQLLVASQGAQSVIGEKIDRLQSALAEGVTLVLPAEVPWIDARLVDLPNEPNSAQTLALEATFTDFAPVVAWRGGRRWTRSFDDVISDMPPPLRKSGTYLITGDLSGIGFEIAKVLARDWKANLLLITGPQLGTGKSEPQASAIAELERKGGHVLTLAGDVSDKAWMREAIDLAQKRWGPIDGVFHAAGNKETRRVTEYRDLKVVETALKPAIDGLMVLQQVLGCEKLDFVALLGKGNGVVGLPGALASSAANAVLSCFSNGVERPTKWRNVIAASIDCAYWERNGPGRAVARPSQSTGSQSASGGTASAENAVIALLSVLGAPVDRVIITPFDLRTASASTTTDFRRDGAGEIRNINYANRELPGGPPQTEREQRIAAIWSELTGVSSIGRDETFLGLGGHWALATRLVSLIRKNESSALQLQLLFENPPLRDFAAYFNVEDPTEELGRTGHDDLEEILL